MPLWSVDKLSSLLCCLIRHPVSGTAIQCCSDGVAGDDSGLSATVVATFNDSLNSKLKALIHSLHQLKDANRYTQKCLGTICLKARVAESGTC